MLFIHLSAFSLRDEIRKTKRREVIWLVQILTSLSIITQSTLCSHPRGSHRLTNAWLVSLNRVKSWLVVSNSALQINSNHSQWGPSQSGASSSWKTTSKFLLQSEMEKFRVAFRDDSYKACLLTFRVTLECGLFICTCRSSRWKKFTLSWKVSEPPEEQQDPS